MGRKTRPSNYDVHPGVISLQNWVTALPEKTGRSLDEWIALVESSGPVTDEKRTEWLKGEHQLTPSIASSIVERCEGGGTELADPASYLKAACEWVDEMFSGKKAALRPIYEALLLAGKGLGSDVRVCPCKTIVPLYRRHVFAQVKPTANTRVDLGLALRDTPASGRLIDTGGFAKKDRISHRIPLTKVEEIDQEVLHWLRQAYEMDTAS